ncbi:MAG: RluA family pseudouridine synthase [Thermodesulfovibrionales bacterium]
MYSNNIGNNALWDEQEGMIQELTVEESGKGQRIDLYLTKRTGLTRSKIQRLINEGYVLVNGERVKQNYKVKETDRIMINTPAEEPEGLIPEPLPVEILYKDDYLVVVNKPTGMVVYPAAGHRKGTLMNALAYHLDKMATIGGPLRPGVVHRLDKDTSGVMVIATDDRAYYDLVEQFRKRSITRRYIALIYGSLKDDEGEIAKPIGRSERNRKKMSTVVRRGKEAVTRWRVIKRFKDATLIEVRLGTGRTHQIRVHFSSIGHPVLGDRTYGRKTELVIGKRRVTFPRQMLHAESLGFRHPATEEYMEFSSPIPEDMKIIINTLSQYS